MRARTIAALIAILASCNGAPPVTISMPPGPPTATAAPTPMALVTLTPGPSPSAAPAFVVGRSPGAGTVVFPVDRTIWRYDAETGALEALGARDGATHIARGDRGYYVADTLIDLGSGAVRRVPALASAEWLEAAEFSPDGRSIAYIADRRRLLVSFDGSTAHPVGPGLELVGPIWSPDGSRLLVQKCHSCGALGAVMTLMLYERDADRLIDFYDAPATRWIPPPGRPMASLFGQFFEVHSWSPDGRYVAGWVMNAGGSGEDLQREAQDGLPFMVFDVAARTAFDLGPVSRERSFVSWGPPHQLAFVAGRGWASWSAKRLSIWSPERGSMPIEAAGEIALSPSWSDAGDLFYIRGKDVDHSPAAWARGIGSAESEVVVRAPAGRSEVVMRARSLTAVRASTDGKSALLLSTTSEHPEIDYLDGAHGTSVPLVRLDPLPAWLRPDLASIAWSR